LDFQKDLDRPDRFVYVLPRPQWDSWLVRGGYVITLFGGLATLWMAGIFLEIQILETIGFWGSAVFGVLVAIYTAFLFAQAKGRDFWQSPTMVLHMLTHSIMAGAAAIILTGLFMDVPEAWLTLMGQLLIISLLVNLGVMLIEMTITHPTEDAKLVVKMILKGRYASLFWWGVVVFGNIIPLALIMLGYALPAAIIAIVGIYLTEKIWVEAPQRIPLT
jgi:formate-dependent nitrite reductase membrane component NrfD